MPIDFEENKNNVINTKNNVEVELPSTNETKTKSDIVVEAAVTKWTILGDDIYIANKVDELPTWFQGKLDNYLTYNSSLSTNVSNLQTAFDNLEQGYTQQIGLFQDDLDTISFNIQNNYVTNSTYSSGIQNLEISKVGAEEASTIARTVIGSWQIDPTGGGAWFDSKIQTFSDTQSSQAQSISSLSASYNGLNVAIEDTNQVVATIEGWSANASKLITGPDGEITGWSFADGSNINSEFTINADNFKISNSSNTYIPFQINNNKISYDGVVDFTNTNIENGFPGTTTINGGMIETNTIDANRITTNYAWVNGSIQSSDFTTIGGSGFRLKANALGTETDPTIYGAYIKGAIIEAPNIISQNLLKVHGVRYTDLFPGYGSFNVIGYNFNTTSTREVIINIDSHYYVEITNNTSNRYTDTFKAQLIIDGVVQYESPAVRIDATYTGDYGAYEYVNEKFIKVLPETHTYITTLQPGSHTILWKAVQTNAVGDQLILNYNFRSITVTDYQE